MCEIYTKYNATSEKEHGSSACKVDIPFAKASGLSLCTGGQIMLYLYLSMTYPDQHQVAGIFFSIFEV